MFEMGNIRATRRVFPFVVGLDRVSTFGASKLEIAFGTFQVQRLGEFSDRNGGINVNQAFSNGRFSHVSAPSIEKGPMSVGPPKSDLIVNRRF